MNPKEVAVNLIKVYVERGDSIKGLKSGLMGSFSSDSRSSISGWKEGKHYSSDYILVERVNGEECFEVFKLKELYEEIKNPSRQVSLL
jgi:hypothetical protein